jgi:YHS domain-containing protein
VDPKFTATYQGRTIAFCCEHCLREFKDADENGKAEIAAKAK